MRRRIIAALTALAGAAALVLAGPVAAEAHPPITYIADCPVNELGETATWQQLTIQTWSPDYISVTAWEYYPNGNIIPLGTAGPGDNGQVFWMPGADGDVVRYDITSPGNTNYFYWVTCLY